MVRRIRAAGLSKYAEVARHSGLDPQRMLSEFGLPARCLQEPELRVPLDALRQLLEASAERSGVEAFGLLMAEARLLSDLGPLGLLVREQPTLRLALEACVRYGRRLNEGLFLTVSEFGDVVVVREELIVGQPGAVRQTTELAIGVAFRVLRTFLGAKWRPRRVCFAHKAPANQSVHKRVFARSVEFDQDFNGIVCVRSDLEVANPNADPGLARLARQMLESEAATHSTAMAVQVHEVIVTLLGTGTCSADRVAQHLGVNRRTIHRLLVQEGETFSAIVDAVRRELAARCLNESSRSLAEVASLLGFASPTGFSRWYRQQFKVKPSAHRARVGRS
jgi:AraC-like DNA-binding protein